MEQPLITLLCKEQAAEAALNGSSARKAPQGEALTQGKASHFCRRKFCEQNFMQARGSREAADNFCLIVRKHDEARGSLGKRKKFESTSIVCLRRHFPRYRRFFRAFLSQKKKRKRGKQG